MKFIIFDIDGTLTDTTHVDDQCFMQAFKTIFGIDIFDKNWSLFENVTDWGLTHDIIVNEWKRAPTITEYKSIKAEFIKLLRKEYKLNKLQFKEIQGASYFIEFLKQKKDIAVGIATGSWRESAILKLESIGVSVKDYAFSSSSKFMKREDIVSDVIRQLNERTETLAERIIYFGDGIWDFRTCQKLDIDFIGIDSHQKGTFNAVEDIMTYNNFENPLSINNHMNM